MSMSVEASMLLRIHGDPCVKTFVQTRSFHNAVVHQAWEQGVHAACLDLKHIRLIPRVKNKATHLHEWEGDARAAGVRPRAVVPVKKGPALVLMLEADAAPAPTVHPSVDQINKIIEDMETLRAEVGSLVADTQRQQQAIEANGKAIKSIRKAVESNGKAIESNGKAIESNGKAIESNGKAIESIRMAVEANGKRIESHGKSLKKMQDQIAVHDTLINALLPWATRDILVSKRCMLEKYRETLFAAVRVNEDDSVVDLIQRVRASNPDKVVLWALDEHSSISADINEPLDIEEARAVVRDDEDVNYDEVYFRLYDHRCPKEES